MGQVATVSKQQRQPGQPLANARQEAFALGLSKGMSQADAYEAAGYKRDEPHAARLASNGKVRERVAELVSQITEAVVATEVLTKERVLQEIKAIATFDIRKAITWDGDGVVRFKSSDEIDDDTAAAMTSLKFSRRSVRGADGESEPYEDIELRFERKPQVLALAAKVLGLEAPQKVEHTGKDGGPIKSETKHGLSAETLETIRREALGVKVKKETGT